MIDDAIRQFQEPPRQPGAQVQAPAPTTAGITVATLGAAAPAPQPRQHVEARLLTIAGPAHTETGNVYHQTPQLEMEIGVFMEQAYVLNGGGAITVDQNISNVWNVSLAGAATITFAAPKPLPQGQIDAGRDRNRATGIVLRIVRNGFDYSLAGVEVPVGTSARLDANSNRDKWVADWWGGPDLGSNWEAQLVASGYEAF